MHLRLITGVDITCTTSTKQLPLYTWITSAETTRLNLRPRASGMSTG